MRLFLIPFKKKKSKKASKTPPFELFAGAFLGRKHADLNIEDPQVSSKHAFIEKNSKGALVLVDNNSRNGLIVRENDSRLKTKNKIVLKPGVVFQIGDTWLEVTTNTSSEDWIDSPSTELIEGPTVNINWTDQLLKLNDKALKKKSLPNKLTPFSPLIELKITAGQQRGTQWLIGYGPRKIGSRSIEFPVQEEGAPPICFEISNNEKGHLFSTEYPNEVLFNGRSSPTEKILHKDKITIGSTIIEIGLVHV